MSSGSTGGDITLSTADRRILQYLSSAGADYPALIASNTGLHIPLVERRCDALEAAGLVELVSDEVLYRLTAYGRTVA
jgi:DNA-binding MarR family transcriptional regulator